MELRLTVDDGDSEQERTTEENFWNWEEGNERALEYIANMTKAR